MANPAASDEIKAALTRRGYGLIFWCTVLLIALGLYFGAYCSLVFVGGVQLPNGGKIDFYRLPGLPPHHLANDLADLLFIPGNSLDRRIRPRVWHATLDELRRDQENWKRTGYRFSRGTTRTNPGRGEFTKSF